MASTRSHNQSVNITKTVVDKTPLPRSGQLILRDANVKGFGLRIMASGARAFILEKRIDGKVRRLTLGRFGELTCEQARKAALKVLGQLALGHNPIAEREREKVRGLSLDAVFADFCKARSLKERTLYDYGRLVEVAFAAWKTRPLISLSRAAVVKLHQDLGETRGEVPHVLPLSSTVLALLQRRQRTARNEFVFPGDGKAGHLIEPKRQIVKVIAASDVSFTLHDLRRTFITVAESLDIPPYAIKRLVNHKMRNDVTAGYIISDVERLRAPMQKITDFLDRATGRSDSARIIPICASAS